MVVEVENDATKVIYNALIAVVYCYSELLNWRVVSNLPFKSPESESSSLNRHLYLVIHSESIMFFSGSLLFLSPSGMDSISLWLSLARAHCHFIPFFGTIAEPKISVLSLLFGPSLSHFFSCQLLAFSLICTFLVMGPVERWDIFVRPL